MRCSALGGGLYRERIVGTHRAVEFPHAPPVRSSCRRGVRGDTRSSRVRAVNNRAPHAATLGLESIAARAHNSHNTMARRQLYSDRLAGYCWQSSIRDYWT
ncbi:unnamed protein product [Arctia plantaginis]|uniref:Uncharacterized protein n=1 Tax=Arctia plantaginis TaxID=874455 RepID=A0A8S0ZQZ3_ARCPL|nr:unnamed protein product [Arctia plantaginis]